MLTKTLLTIFLLTAAYIHVIHAKTHSNTTSTSPNTKNSTDLVETRKGDYNKYEASSSVRRGLSLLGSLGGGGGGQSGSGGQGLAVIQQSLQGIKNMQKFISNIGSVIRLPFSFRGVSDTMATITGLLAAVGGGYLTYVSMVGLFGNMIDPNGAYSQPGAAYYDPAQVAAAGYGIPAGYGHVPTAGQQGPHRRQSYGGLHLGSLDLSKIYSSVTNFNYPEASFKLLRIKDESCKHRAVCELEKFLAKKGVASVILKGVSKKITGMEKYLDAAYRGLSNEDCSFTYSACPQSLGQTLLRTIGLN